MEVTDPFALRAMAHPLRLDLIELLGSRGPLTAAECARHLDSTQARCSYHLRHLAKYGFVERADAGDDARERPWRITDIEQRWSDADHDPAAAELDRIFVQREADRILAWQASAHDQPSEWADTSFFGGATLPLTAEEAAQVRDELFAVIAPYVERLRQRTNWPADHRFVRVLLAATPSSTDPNGEQR